MITDGVIETKFRSCSTWGKEKGSLEMVRFREMTNAGIWRCKYALVQAHCKK